MTTPPLSWPSVLGILVGGADLSADQTAWAMDQIMTGSATAAQVAGFAVGLRAKGETSAEIAAMAATMLQYARKIEVCGLSVDIVGTGGDLAGTVNISTMAAIVTAATGAQVVKHGSRASSSKSGTADVLEELGIVIELGPAAVSESVRRAGIGFCFAPAFHPALRHAASPRRELGIPTAFNILGPLTNPARPKAGLIGCANPRLAPVMAQVFADRQNSTLVVRGTDGLDELTTTTTSTVWWVRDGDVRELLVDPARLGITPATHEDLRGGDAVHNAEVIRELVAGKPGPVREAVLLNAAGALVALGSAERSEAGLHTALTLAMERAAAAIDSGAAASLLDTWASTTRELA